jgi:hypothetical protein
MITRVLPVIAVTLVISVATSLLLGTRLGYYETVGLLGCAALIIVSNWLGDILLSHPEEFYPDDVAPDVEHDVQLHQQAWQAARDEQR